MSQQERKVEFTPQALADIEAILVWIERDAPETAVRVASEIVDSALSLGTMPLRGSAAREGDLDGIRLFQIVRHRHRIVYSVRPDVITIHYVVQGSRESAGDR